jgi:8-oxo-dGTP pyrophosphatase MutT (NUDIX family)
MKVRTNPGLWSGVAGMVDDGESPESTGFREISEELGMRSDQVELKRMGETVLIRTKENEIAVIPLLFESTTRIVKLNWEHTESTWAKPADVERYSTVPRFKEVLGNLGLV